MKRYTITSVEAVRYPVLRITFDDGLVGELDLTDDIEKGELFETLRDPDCFKQVSLEEDGRSFGWNLGEVGKEIDLCADSARAEIESNLVETLAQEWRSEHVGGRALPGRATAKADERGSALTYQIYRDAQGNWRWLLVTSSGKTIAQSGEGYLSKDECISAIELMKSSQALLVVDSDAA